ncbi:MAG: endonuclease MutS2 [Lachnospiraceae bacterium]|nr:endonuclease MutS2 [Lachnospiraceae bacterium]
MNEKALHTLEFDKIINLLTERASSAPGKALCAKTHPLTDIREIDRLQEETAAAVSRVFARGSISFGNNSDVRGSLLRLDLGSALSIREILAVTKLLENAGTVRNYGKKQREDAPDDVLSPLFEVLESLPQITGEVRRCILSEEEISDNASPKLRQIRRSIKLAGDRIHSELSRIIAAHGKDYLQDSLVTTRDGRYCVPVKSEYKGQVGGIVHDMSSSGSTLFIEPTAVVNLNNEIRQLEGDEQKEIEAILARLSEMLNGEAGFIRQDYEVLTALDYIFARASLAISMDATRPLVNSEGILDLKKARHPMIDKKKVVPTDIRLGETFDLLVITGPNTGGKTVTLKTSGLLTLMGLSGLHIPAADRSRIALFEEVYADIGDEQSIEQSLSTFSSHMKNIVEFLKTADECSLVLFDELGAGTDPTEGAALAVAILDSLHARGIRTLATTHYSEIKVYALRTPGVENASCEFDVSTLSPTYRLLIGVPGKSNAFAISKKLGLSDAIINDARNLLSDQAESFEDVISDLESKRISLENERLEAERTRREIEALKKDLAFQKEHLSEQKKKLIAESQIEARKILEDAKAYADKQIAFFARQGGIPSGRELEKERDALRTRINELHSQTSDIGTAGKSGNLKKEELKAGDPVRVLSLNLKGTVSSLPDAKGQLFVTCGIMRMKVKLSDLEKLEEKDIEGPGIKKSSAGKLRMEKSKTATGEINLLGMTVDEAVMELDKFIDNAAIAHLPSIRIVHGKGTGKLRQGVQQYLKRNRHIKSFRLGEYGEGDAGVTIAELK